jgi:3-oxoacyl-(acyl-carrier-protein) synthase
MSVYSEARIDPATVAYVEAHGTGTKVGDPQEINSIVDVFCKGRQGPLKIGSVKSNMGHPEPASGELATFSWRRQSRETLPNVGTVRQRSLCRQDMGI